MADDKKGIRPPEPPASFTSGELNTLLLEIYGVTPAEKRSERIAELAVRIADAQSLEPVIGIFAESVISDEIIGAIALVVDPEIWGMVTADEQSRGAISAWLVSLIGRIDDTSVALTALSVTQQILAAGPIDGANAKLVKGYLIQMRRADPSLELSIVGSFVYDYVSKA